MADQASNIALLLQELARPGLNQVQKAALTQELEAQKANPNKDAQQSRDLAVNSAAYDQGIAKTAGGKVSPPNSASGAFIPDNRMASITASATPPSTAAGAPTPGTTVGAPTAAATSINSVLDALSSQVSGLTSKLTEARGATTLAAGKSRDVASQAIDISLQEAKDRQAVTQATLAQFGIGTGDKQAFERYQTVQKQRTGLADQILANESINPLKDPIGYLMGNIKNIWLTDQHNTLAAMENDAESSIKDLQSMASNGIRLTPELVTAQLDAKAANEKAALEAKQLITEGEVRVQQIRDEISGVRTEKQIALQGYDISARAQGAERAIQSQEDAAKRAEARLNLQMNPPEKPLTKIQQLKVDAEMAQLAELEKTAVAQSDLTGIPTTAADVAAKGNSEVANIARQYATTGQLGSTPAEAFSNAKTINLAKSPIHKNAAQVVDLYSRKVDQAYLTLPANDPSRPKNPKALEAWKAEQLIKELDADLTVVQKDASRARPDAKNPFVLREGDATLLPALESNYVKLTLDKVKLAGLADKGWDTQGTMQAVIASGLSDKISPEVLADEITRFYSVGLQEQTKNLGLDVLAIGGPMQYRVGGVLQAKGASFLGGTNFATPDLLNKPALLKAIEDHMMITKAKAESARRVGTGRLFD